MIAATEKKYLRVTGLRIGHSIQFTTMFIRVITAHTFRVTRFTVGTRKLST